MGPATVAPWENPTQLERPAFLLNFPFSFSTQCPNNPWMQDLPDDHEVYSLHYRVSGEDRPKLRYVTNGSRVLMVHSPSDLTQHWQLRADKSKRAAFELGVNLFHQIDHRH